MKLNDRKLKILQAIIDDYIATAEPVGSRSLSKKYILGISPATIRNEMADLEDLGLLIQPHTSAGRIPSDKGYRLYVDNLMEIKALADIHRQQLKMNLLKKFGEVEQLLHHSSKILSQLTNYTSVSLTSQLKESKLKHMQLVPVNSDSIVAVIVTDTGIIKNPVLRLIDSIDYEQLQKVSNFLNETLQGLTIKEIENKLQKELKQELIQFNKMFKSIIPQLFKVLEEIDDMELFSSGITKIFNFPEFNDVIKAKSFFGMLEEKKIISSLISSSHGDGVDITIGSENIHKEARECSFVTATYKIDGYTIGWLSVIGPTRMDYSNVVGVMLQISNYMNQWIKNHYK